MLTSVQNPLVKAVRKLHQAKGRRLQQQFLLEGTHLVQEARRTGYSLDLVCYTESWEQRYPALLAQLVHHSHRLQLVSEPVLAAMATTVHPDGVIAVAPQRPSPSMALNRLGLAFETLQDPGNFGTIIRTAVAASVDGLWLSQDSVAPDHPKVLRASAGQWFQMRMAVIPDLRQQVQQWRADQVQVVATCLTAAIPYWAIDFRRPTVILLGNEGAGLTADLQAMATLQTTIPMAVGVESLNVAISTALLVYEAQRQWAGGEPLEP